LGRRLATTDDTRTPPQGGRTRGGWRGAALADAFRPDKDASAVLTGEVREDDFIQRLLADQVLAEEGLHADLIGPRLLLERPRSEDLGRQLARLGRSGRGGRCGRTGGRRCRGGGRSVRELPRLVADGRSTDVLVHPVDEVAEHLLVLLLHQLAH